MKSAILCLRSHFLAVVMLLALPVAASDFGTNYPAGSIRDSAAAQAALKAADAEMARIVQDEKRREAECYRGFLVNSCRDNVRRERQLAEREVRRVQLEAHDLQRRLDSEQVAERRAQEAEARAAEDAQRPQKEAAARAANEARTAELQRRNAAENEQRGGTSSSGQERRPTQDRLTAAERAENVRKYQQKQLQAEKRAEEKEAERKKNEQRRAEKRKQIAQREAEREAVRKKAAEALRQ